MANLMSWLFTDAYTEGLNTPSGNPTPFNAAPWLIVIGFSLLVVIYYSLEGRRKIPFIKNHRIWKQYVLDRLLQHVAWWAGIGLFIIGGRVILFYTLFSWRIWIVLWLGWLAGIVFYWAKYFISKHGSLMETYNREVDRARFLPSAQRSKQ